MIKVLVVDDEKIIRDGLCKTIPWQEMGYELVGDAANGKEVLATVKDSLPDLIITDIRMPWMSGLDMIEKLRELYPAMQFIVLSGYEEFAYAQKAITLGVVEYMLKPIYRPDLMAVLERVKLRLEEPQGRDTASHSSIVSRALEYIASNYSEATLKRAAMSCGVTPEYLSTLIRSETGANFSDHLKEARMERAKFLLGKTLLKNYEIADAVGYSDARHFSQTFKKSCGMLPGAYRAKVDKRDDKA